MTDEEIKEKIEEMVDTHVHFAHFKDEYLKDKLRECLSMALEHVNAVKGNEYFGSDVCVDFSTAIGFLLSDETQPEGRRLKWLRAILIRTGDIPESWK